MCCKCFFDLFYLKHSLYPDRLSNTCYTSPDLIHLALATLETSSMQLVLPLTGAIFPEIVA